MPLFYFTLAHELEAATLTEAKLAFAAQLEKGVTANARRRGRFVKGHGHNWRVVRRYTATANGLRLTAKLSSC